MDTRRGDPEAALRTADITVDATYTVSDNTNNPLGLLSTVAVWDGDTLLIHDATQWPYNVRTSLATVFGVPESGVRALSPLCGRRIRRRTQSVAAHHPDRAGRSCRYAARSNWC